MKSSSVLIQTIFLIMIVSTRFPFAILSTIENTRQERFIDDELQKWAYGALKVILDGEPIPEDKIASFLASPPPVIIPEIFGQQINSPSSSSSSSSSKEGKFGDLRSLKEKIREVDEKRQTNLDISKNREGNQIAENNGVSSPAKLKYFSVLPWLLLPILMIMK